MLVNHISAFRLRIYIIPHLCEIINGSGVNLFSARRIPRSGTPFWYNRRGMVVLIVCSL